MYLATTADIKIETDSSGNIIREDGVDIVLPFKTVTYHHDGTVDLIEGGVEYFMGTLGNDLFEGSAIYSINSGLMLQLIKLHTSI